MSNSQKSRSFNYSIFNFVTDSMKGTSVPVGVALWSPYPEFCKIRLIKEGEKTRGLPPRALPFIQLTEEKISEWMKTGAIPYAKGELNPANSEWWRHVSRLLIHNLRVSDPRPIECRNPDDELELLYEAIVAPVKSKQERVGKMNGVLTRALGQLAAKLPQGSVPGFGGREVWVRRHAENDQSLLIVEGVNLAATTAEKDADALVSRLQRILEAAPGTGKTHKLIAVMVGYLSSPEGLNGEAALRDWIEEKTKAQTFDLINQEDQFRTAVHDNLESISA